jgi:cyclic pyranopterin phosphate synthase
MARRAHAKDPFVTPWSPARIARKLRPFPVKLLPVIRDQPIPIAAHPERSEAEGLASRRAASADPLLDRFARRVRYLRVSVTDRCNFRCVYCMPEDIEFRPRAELLTFEEIERIVRVFVGLGVRKVRLTGGEPTVRAKITDLVARLAGVPGLEQIVMTTNGHLLAELAAPLAAAGLRAVNVSVDTVDPDHFRAVTVRGDLSRVLAGIDAAIAVGLKVKLNAVMARGLADATDDAAGIARLCELAWNRGIVIRFIEHMPMSAGELFAPDRAMSAAMIHAAVEAAYGPLVVAEVERDAGPARTWHLAGDPAREIGVISAMTEHFCDTCNRLRLTATGDLHACLGHDDATPLRDLLRACGSDADLGAAIGGAVATKREGHTFQVTGAGAPGKHMVSIGG